MNTDVQPLVYRPEEVARLLNMSVRSVYRRVNDGTLEARRMGRLIVIPRVALEEFLSGEERAS